MINGYLEKLLGRFPRFDFELKYSNKEGTEWYGETSRIDLEIKDYSNLPFEIIIIGETIEIDEEPYYIIHKEARDFKAFYKIMRYDDKFILKELISYTTISKTPYDTDWVNVTYECEVGCECHEDKQPFHYDRYIVDCLDVYIFFPHELVDIWNKRTFPDWYNSW